MVRRSLELPREGFTIPEQKAVHGSFVNVNTMKNQFILNPTNDVVLNAEQYFSIENGFINMGVEDLKKVFTGADNVIMLEGRAKGSSRVADAFEEAVLHTCSIAKDYDLFSADKVLVQISANKDHPLLMSEISDLSRFSERFAPNTPFIRGISYCSCNDDTVTVRIIASNIAHKH